jgi:hypothetical protein
MKGNTIKTKTYTMKRKDWGCLIDGVERVRCNEAVMERIGKERWTGKTHDDDNEKLSLNLTDKEVSAIFDANGHGFRHAYYLNTRRMFQQVSRVYKAFGFQPPKEHLPHIRLKAGQVSSASTDFVNSFDSLRELVAA